MQVFSFLRRLGFENKKWGKQIDGRGPPATPGLRVITPAHLTSAKAKKKDGKWPGFLVEFI